MFLGRTIMQPLLLDLRVHLRVPEDRPGDRQQSGELRHVARGRHDRERDDLPGRAGRRAAARAGLRLHARDRRPRARADAGVGRRRRESGRRARSRRCSRRWWCSRSRCSSRPTKVHLSCTGSTCITLLPLAAVMSAAFGLTIGTRVATSSGPADLQPARDPDDVPRRGVLPVEEPHAAAVAQGRACSSTRSST